MVSVAVAGAAGRLGAETVAFDYALGPRNAPARDWLAAFSGAALEEGCGRIVMPIPAPAPDGPVTIKWKT